MEPPICFGSYELDPVAGELRKGGVRAPLSGQPLEVLLLLVRRPGEVVTREELKEALWPEETFVDFDNGVNTAIRRIRRALDDSAIDPKYIETLTKRGYRFVGDVQAPEQEPQSSESETVDQRLAHYRVTEEVPAAPGARAYHARDLEDERPVTIRVVPQDLDERERRRRLLLPVLGVLSMALAGLALFFGFSASERSASQRAVRRFTLTFDDPIADPRISPNGRYIAYAKPMGAYLGELWLHDLQTGTQTRVSATNSAENPFWSPDSRFLGYGEISYGETGSGGYGRLQKFEVEGSRSSAVCSIIEHRVHGAAWSSDGTSIALGIGFLGYGGSNVYRITPDQSELRSCLDFPSIDNHGHDYPVLVPSSNGDRVIVRLTETRSSALLSSDGVPFETPELGFVHGFDPAGFLITTRNHGRTSQVWAVPFDPETLQFPGDPFLVAEAATAPSVDSQGTLVYLDSQSLATRLSWRDRAGRALGAVGQPQDSIYFPALSPDGRQVAVNVGNDRNATLRGDIWLHQTEQPLALRLTFDPDQQNYHPVWSPDSQRVAFNTWRNDSLDIFVRDVSGRGGATPLVTTPDVEDHVHDWSPDGRFLVFHKKPESGPNRDLWYLELRPNGEWTEKPLLQTPFEERVAVFSPDGRYVAYVSNESGRDELYVTRFPSGEDRWRISKDGGSQPRWKRSGEISFVRGDTLLAAPVSTKGGFSAGPGVTLFADTGLASPWPAQQYDVSSDGQKFVLRETVQEAGPATLHVVENWYEEFRDRE